MFGQCGRTRTCDPKHPRLPRYQLRYALLIFVNSLYKIYYTDN
ncbi:hypothetical protein [Salmonella phage PS3-1]|nr:hypothetical protein [Salmonella phage PS3-1]